MSAISVHAIRLLPGEDLKKSIQQFAQQQQIAAGWVSTCVGSLTSANLRFANNPVGTLVEGPFEILSLSGMVSLHGCHLHMCVADGEGTAIGGHLVDGNVVYTTAEIVIMNTSDFVFERRIDEATGYRELKIVGE